MAGGEFARRVGAAVQEQDKRYALFLGAGCSISSGIPAAGALVRDHWLPRLKHLSAPDARDDDWIAAKIPDYADDNPAASYGTVMEALFMNPEERQREIEQLCDGRFPAFGYAVLAQLMAREGGAFNVALTTNFDDLLADAMYLYTPARPLVIQHEALAAFIRPTRTRPLVVKLHGDNRLTPMNTGTETAHLKAQFAQEVPALLNDRGLIVLGYGGNDQGIADLLSSLPQRALPLGVYWVSGSEPGGVIREWLEQREAIWVRERDFDELMLLLLDALDLGHPDEHRFDHVFTRYHEAYEEMSARILDSKETGDRDAEALKSAVGRADASAQGDWQIIMNAQRTDQRGDVATAASIYESGLKRFPDSHRLLSHYAAFLTERRLDPARAEALFRRAIDLDPENGIYLGNYALFLQRDHRDADLIDEQYRRALAAEPVTANNLINYATFLHRERRDPERAAPYFDRALAADPNDPIVVGNYAASIRESDPERAEQLFQRALELDPLRARLVANYASFLDTTRGDLDRAEEQFERALALDPEAGVILGGYALFAQRRRHDIERATRLYERALAAEPESSNTLGNYAGFLFAQGERSRAVELAGRALETANPRLDDGLIAEVRFYQWANGPADEAALRLAELKVLIGGGVRSEGWDFSANIERLAQERPDDVGWARKLADVITGDAEPDILDEWDAWRAA